MTTTSCAHPNEGVGQWLNFGLTRLVPHVTLGSIANNPDIKEGMSQAEIDCRHRSATLPRKQLYDLPVAGHRQ